MIIETLKKSKIFSVLNDEELTSVSSLFQQMKFKNSEYIFMEEDSPDWIYVASHGKVKMVKFSQEGKEVILEIKMPGELFCCAAVLGKRPYPDSAQAMEPVTVIRISRKNLIKILDEYPMLHLEIARYANEKVSDAQEMLRSIALERVDQRIAAMLVKLAEKTGIPDAGYVKIDLPLTRQEIADMVGTTSETCIRAMSKFQKEGIVKSSDKRISIKLDSFKKLLEH